MLKRKIFDKLLIWKRNRFGKAFILKGVRQSGKSYIIKKFCSEELSSYVYVDLLTNTMAKDLLNNCKSAEEMLGVFSIIFGNDLIPNETTIVLDEVQAIGKIITYIKYLVQDGRYSYILSGSLLGLALSSVDSVPVGYATIHELFSLDFMEYLWAINYSNDLLKQVKEDYDNKRPVNENIHKDLIKKFNEYLVIGGMPSSVTKFLESRNYEYLYEDHQDILNLYQADFTQYEQNDRKLIVTRIFNNIPSQLNKEYNRYMINEVVQNNRFSVIENSIHWLEYSGVAHKVDLISELNNGITLSKQAFFKLYYSDTGLLISKLGRHYRDNFIIGSNFINKGMIYENVVCQHLVSQNFEIRYFKQKKHGEVDFIIEKDAKILPIEVKSGKNTMSHSGLDFILGTHSFIEEAIVLCNDNYKKVDSITYLPIYMIMFITK